MTDCPTLDASPAQDSEALYADDRYLVRNPRQVLHLLRQLVEQRSLITAHPDGGQQSFPTALLEVDTDDDTLVLDGCPTPSINRLVAEASTLLCYARLDQVNIRFQLQRPQRELSGDYVSFRADIPEAIHHLQRRELYRLETPVNDSPWCQIPVGADDRRMDLRVIDISGGGIALSFPPDQVVLRLNQRLHGCVLTLPDSLPIQLVLEVRDLRKYTAPNGLELQRVGLKFEELPRGADAAIQRYIFRIDRQRKARQNGEL